MCHPLLPHFDLFNTPYPRITNNFFFYDGILGVCFRTIKCFELRSLIFIELYLWYCSQQATEQMLLYMEIEPEKDKTVYKDLRDNRDFSVITSWDPKHMVFSNELKEKSFKEEVGPGSEYFQGLFHFKMRGGGSPGS